MNEAVQPVLLLQQPRCVRCGEAIDVWAQYVCDRCRHLTLWQFLGIAHGPGRFNSAEQTAYQAERKPVLEVYA
jgi:hypothetical protein